MSKLVLHFVSTSHVKAEFFSFICQFPGFTNILVTNRIILLIKSYSVSYLQLIGIFNLKK